MTKAWLEKRKNRILDLEHDEFVALWKTLKIKIYLTESATEWMPDSHKIAYNFMNGLYKYLPVVVIPLLMYFYQNWWIIIGLPIYYLGGLTAQKRWVLLFLCTCFSLGIWIRDGFSWHQYVTIFFFCMVTGFILNRWAENIKKNAIADMMCFSEEIYNLLKTNYSIVILMRISSFYNKK